MVYRQAPDTKVYVLICRDLMTDGYYMLQGHVIVSKIAENIDEAVKKLQVEPISPVYYTGSVFNRSCKIIVKLPKSPPKWFNLKYYYLHRWQKLLNPKLLWEVREVITSLDESFIGDLFLISGTRKKIKIKNEA